MRYPRDGRPAMSRLQPNQYQTDGRLRSEGSKFVQWCDQLELLEQQLPHHRFQVLAENVIMNDDSDTKFFNQRLGAQPVLVDSSDLKVVSRPRLWWSRLDWSKCRAHPFSGEALQWTQQNQHRRLRVGLPPDDIASFDIPEGTFHSSILNGERVLPCFAAPAPDDSGRPPPAKQRGRLSSAAKQRGLQHSRQFAPWHYEDHAMLWANRTLLFP